MNSVRQSNGRLLKQFKHYVYLNTVFELIIACVGDVSEIIAKSSPWGGGERERSDPRNPEADGTLSHLG
jgi:hypothetical protein